MVFGQKVALGRVHAGNTVTINVTDSELAIACDDGIRTVRRTTDQPVRNIKASRPRLHAACPPLLPAPAAVAPQTRRRS
ncbi:hypothetical protein Nm8I071_40300 [Nonomuraea sp. TT08I-71]|nr:hypothetical protein Nm8I071_40300 [Nonomuraea sp. TT08I-71]